MKNVRRLLTRNDNSLFRRHVIEQISTKYSLSPIKAGSLVKRSSFNVMLKRDPEFVMHHSASYWARKVHDETASLLIKK